MRWTTSGWGRIGTSRRGGRWALVLAAVLVATVAVPVGGVAAGSEAASRSPRSPADVAAGPPDVLPADGRWTVTLLTGTVLDVRSDAEGRVTALAREHGEPFRTVRKPDGELYVLPLSLTPLLDGVLDLELFNVTGLIRQRYDDASTDAVPIIVQHEPGVDVQAQLSTAEDERPLPSIGAVATEVPKNDAAATGALLDQLGASTSAHAEAVGGITRIWLDRQVTLLSPDAAGSPVAAGSPDAAGSPASPGSAQSPRSLGSLAGPVSTREPVQTPAGLDHNLTQVGADRAWAAGLTGQGVTVAVLDTGIDSQHPDLAGKVVAEQNFSDSEDTADHFGHGTHVASIIAGTGAASAGARSGVAPDAQLISGKVVDDFGFGSESQAISGMEWAAPQADVVNMSLGYGINSDGSDPISLALDALSDQYETLFVVAAGNSGPLSQTVEFPGAADRALTVGAIDADDQLAEFSSRGPLTGSFELKPEVVAPGVDIVAARAAGTSIGTPVGEQYTTLSGTSMATPHVAGAAADLAQDHPDWSAAQLKDGLVASADPVDGDGYDIGAGRLDIGDGTDATVRADQDVIDVPLAHPRTEPHTETLSWTNTGDQPQTLDLQVNLEDRTGQAIDEASIEPATLTLTPGATGSATVTVDGPDLATGLYSGIVTADPADGPDQDDLRTPIAVHAEPEMANLTIEATAPSGIAGAPSSFAAVINLDDFAEYGQLWFFQDTATAAVPVGRYSVLGDVSSSDFDADVVAQVGEPDITITGDTTVTFDGAAAVPFDPTLRGVEAAPPVDSNSALVTTPRAGTGGFGLLIEVFAWYPQPPVRLTPMEADPEVFSSFQIYRLQAPHLSAVAGGDPIALTSVAGHQLTPGEHTLTAVDAGDGSDLSGAAGQLAVVQLPDDLEERAAVSQRAADAGVALLAFVDEQRPVLTISPIFADQWGDVPVVAVAGSDATRIRAAATAGESVTVTLTASPFVYDIVTPETNVVDPEPVVSRAEQRQLATLQERFHRDPDGVGPTGERRYPISVSLMNLDTEGPLPERRTAHVTPDVTWQSIVFGSGFIRFFGELIPVDNIAVAMDAGQTYSGGSRQTVTWLRRPLAPGPVGGPQGASFCQPLPVSRSGDTLHVWLAPFQDGRDRFGCTDPEESTMTLSRDGTVLGTTNEVFADFPLPAEPGTYRLSYDQAGHGPYATRSTTAWTFPSGPSDAEQLIPLLVVDYRLPLDTMNRPTGRTATFTVHQVTGADQQRFRSVRVWTSTDDGATWRRASVERRDGGSFRVTLPRVDRGTAVSLRVDARDVAGSRIEQTLFGAYTG